MVLDGYAYHTENDLADIIPMGTYQNVGDNLLSLAKTYAGHEFRLALSDELVLQENDIFFDYLGWFFVRYSRTSALIINVLVPLATLTLIVVSLVAFVKRFGKFSIEICKFQLI